MNTDLVILICLVVVFVLGVVVLLVLAIKNKWISKLYPTVQQAMKEAEASGKPGAEKKAYVLAKVQAKCEELKIPYKFIHWAISNLIELIVKYYNALSK